VNFGNIYLSKILQAKIVLKILERSGETLAKAAGYSVQKSEKYKLLEP